MTFGIRQRPIAVTRLRKSTGDGINFLIEKNITRTTAKSKTSVNIFIKRRLPPVFKKKAPA